MDYASEEADVVVARYAEAVHHDSVVHRNALMGLAVEGLWHMGVVALVDQSDEVVVMVRSGGAGGRWRRK